MSFLQLTSTGYRSGMMVPKRYLHRTTDAFYLRHWQKMNVDFKAHTGGKLYQSPRLVTQILQVQSAMRQKGYFTFIHGAPASSRVMTHLYEAMYGKQKPYYKYLRPHSDQYMTKAEKTPSLFMSYSLSSGLWFESAAYFGFNRGPEFYFQGTDYFKSCLKDSGVKITPEFEKKVAALFLKSNCREVGEFYILGINEKDVNKYITDVHPVGKPTGKDVKDVSQFPGRHMDTLEQHQAHLVTMALCYDTLHPSSDIVMIDPNNSQEVDSFCAGLSFKSMKEIPEYEGLVSEKDTDFEKEQLEKRATIDKEIEQVALQFKEMLKNPDAPKFESIQEEEWETWDVPFFRSDV